MKTKILSVLGIIVAGIYSLGLPNPTKSDSFFAITNTSIINIEDGKILKEQTIIIENDIIKEIGHSNMLEVPEQATLVSGKNKYVIPGLWDMHAHTSSPKITRDVIYPLFIANGITGIRVLSGDCFEPCWELTMPIAQSKILQAEVKEGLLVGPRAIFSSDLIHGAKPGKLSTIEAPGTREDGRKLVHHLIKRDVDFIKIYNEVPREAYFGIAEEANKQGLNFAGHVPIAVKASEASEAGQKSIEHCCAGNILEECSKEEQKLREKITALIQTRSGKNMNSLVLELVKTYDSIKCQALFKKFKFNNTYFTPTLIATEMDNILKDNNWRQDPRLKYIAKKELKFWEENEMTTMELLGKENPLIRKKRFEIIEQMNQTGVKLLAGSDCGVFGVYHGFSLHDELELLVEAGLTELEALQTATLNAVNYAGLTDSIGKIEKGMKADLILLNANPLKSISNTKRIHAVFTNKQYFDRAKLNTMLEKVAAEANE
ncbi:amidohydrolase family protein [Christiangramia aquimixticola]|uniref:amidohydrolase family protein n=1 Tax=Christiangramia aquimixticola TaxID=1697558 RepID=UPI003AA881DE